jgi:HAD superfamily hydrolase (TIGR01509 family)
VVILRKKDSLARLLPAAIEAIVFDMDGLMLDTEPIFKRAWQKAASGLGCPVDDTFYLSLIDRTNVAAEAELTRRWGGEFPIAAFRERWTALWREEVASYGIRLKPGLAELLEYSARLGIPTGIATSSDREFANFSLKAAGLDTEAFRCIVSGDEISRSKPAPDIYLEAAGRLGADPKRCLALEDSDSGILAASAAGMIAVMAPDLKPPSEHARAHAFATVRSLAEVVSMLEQRAGMGAGPCFEKSRRGRPPH